MQASSLAAVSCESQSAPVRRWTVEEVLALYEMPLMDLIFRAQTVHREHFDPNAIQRSTLLSVKTGGCSEDCSYCSQSARYDTETGRERLMPVDEVVAAANVGDDRDIATVEAEAFAQPVRPRPTARRVSAWGLPGKARRTTISTVCSRWCAR